MNLDLEFLTSRILDKLKMTTHYFEFNFIHEGKLIPATCFVYIVKGATEMPYKYPMYRVALKNKKYDPDVFLFYEVNRDDKRFFWYPLPDEKAEIAKSIGEFLEQFDYRRTKYKVLKDPIKK